MPYEGKFPEVSDVKPPRDSSSLRRLFVLFTPDKAKPSVRRGQKAADLIKSKMAELPKDEPAVSSAFF